MSHGKHGSWKTLQLKVQGMHCANCEVLIERRFKKISGIRKVTARHTTGTAEVSYYGHLEVGALQDAIKDDGYTVLNWNEKADAAPVHTNSTRDFAEIGAAVMIIAALVIVLKQFDILPERLAMPSTISYGLAFVIGLVASVSTCMAVTGGLLVAVAARYNATNSGPADWQRFKPHIYFNAGRVVSYTLLGGAIGALGSTLTLSVETSGLLIILASAVMIVLGLQMLNLFPWLKRFQPRLPKFLGHKIHDLSERKVKGGAFLLGASTFFLPCGFTQALQLYVLAKGDFATGALVMLAFALGTLPALLSLSALSSFVTGSFQRYFLKFAGVTVVLLGLFNIQSGLTLTATAVGSSAPVANNGQPASGSVAQKVPVVDGKQIVDMKIVGYRYEPHQFAVVQGMPVEWRIDAQQAAGCGRILIAPRAGVRKLLPYGTTTISFTPQEAGEIRFNCSMGMMTRDSKITVLASAPNVAEAKPAPGPRASAAVYSPSQRVEIEGILKAYLLKHPEVLQEAIAALEKRQQDEELETHRAAVKDNASTLFSSPRQVVLGNPQGDVTLVEFFDYNCAYCKRALSDMVGLIKADPKLRIVLKEFPVLGEGSTAAAKVAVAVRMQDPSGQKYLEFHQKLLGERGQADGARALAVAKAIGLDAARLERDLASDEVKASIAESLALAESLGLNGTPSYVVGSDVVVGAVGLAVLQEKIAAARK